MRFVPRLSLPVKITALAVMTAFLAAQPLLDASRRLAAGGAASGTAMCLRDHDPIVDRLLPEGPGGTVFFSELGEFAGVAFQETGTIGVALAVEASDSLSAVELHERAHLLEFASPQIVARLMREQPAPKREEYAATSPVEPLLMAEPSVYGRWSRPPRASARSSTPSPTTQRRSSRKRASVSPPMRSIV